MRLNRFGRAVGGRTTPHVSGVPVAAFSGRVAGSPVGCWWGDRVLCQTQVDGAWRLVSALPGDADFRVDDGRGQNRLFANSRIWVADLDGYRDSLGNTREDLRPVALDDARDQVAVRVVATNALAIYDPHLSAVIATLEADGPDIWQDDDLDFKAGWLFYRKYGRLKQWPEAGPIAHIDAVGVRASLGFLMEYQEGRGVVVRPQTETRGIVLVPAGQDAFGRDLRVLEDGRLMAVWSAGPLEQPGEFREAVIDVSTGTVNGQAREWMDLAEPPPAIDEPAMPVPSFAPMPVRLRVFDEPGSLAIIGVDDEPDASTVGIFCTLGRDDVARTAEACRRRGLPFLAYRDDWSYPPSFVPTLPGVDVVPTVMAYPYRADDGTMEDVATTARHIAATVMSLQAQHPRVAVVMAAYRQIRTVKPLAYNWQLEDVLALQAAVWDVCRTLGVHDIFLFTWTRASGADGIVSRPELQESLRRMRGAALQVPANTGVPGIPEPVTPTPQPPVTPAETDMPAPPQPDMNQFVTAAIPRWAADYQRVNGSAPGPKDVAHIAFRTLVEGGAPDVMVVAPRIAPYAYDELLDMIDALSTVRVDSGGAAPDAGLLAFWAYQLLIEGKRYDRVVEDARTV